MLWFNQQISISRVSCDFVEMEFDHFVCFGHILAAFYCISACFHEEEGFFFF